MKMQNCALDGGKEFDWGKTSADYARYRDIYPQVFYDKIIERGLCMNGQRVLDLGTGTGVLPRNLYSYGAKWVGIDASDHQIAEAKRLSAGMEIAYDATPAEKIALPDKSLDVVTACQCFWYFDHETLMPQLHRMLKPDGSLLVLYMAWLPYDDTIAGASEQLILRYHPQWSGAGETMHPIWIPECYHERFRVVHSEEYLLDVPFTRESWHGRIRASRGVGASLSAEALAAWEKEHLELLQRMAPPQFTVRHYAAMTQLQPK